MNDIERIFEPVRWYSGLSGFDSGTGFWLGNDSGTPKFSIGNSSGNKLTWDGSTLTVVGAINFPGGFTAADTSGDVIGRKDTDVVTTDGATYKTLHEFTVRGTGTVTVRAEMSRTGTSSQANARILRNGSTTVGASQAIPVGSASELTWTITLDDPADTYQLQANYLAGGGAPATSATVWWSEVRARLSHAFYT